MHKPKRFGAKAILEPELLQLLSITEAANTLTWVSVSRVEFVQYVLRNEQTTIFCLVLSTLWMSNVIRWGRLLRKVKPDDIFQESRHVAASFIVPVQETFHTFVMFFVKSQLEFFQDKNLFVFKKQFYVTFIDGRSLILRFLFKL